MNEKFVELQKTLDNFPKWEKQFELDELHDYASECHESIEDFREKFAVFRKEIEEERKCNEIKMGAMLKALEQKHREVEGKISVDKKQLQERVLEIDKPSNGYGEVCEQNRQYRILLKELLLGSEGSKEAI